MHKHRWAVFAAAFLVAGAVVAASFAGPSRSTAGKTFYFIPKDTLNPYEVIADRGGKLALTELGDKQVALPSAEAGTSGRDTRHRVRLGCELPRAVHQPGRHGDDRP